MFATGSGLDAPPSSRDTPHSSDVPPFLDALNAEQRTAACHEGGPLRILAGAGTGKTTTLTARVARLVASGVPAERMLLLTFTRRAAREMVTRAQALVDSGGRGSAAGGHARGPRARIQGGTFHSVAHRVLRRHAASLGLPEGFSVLDTADAADVIDLVRHELGLTDATGRRFPRKATILDLSSRAVNTQQPLSTVVDQQAPWCLDRIEPLAELCRGYVARKRELGVLDFDDLLLYWRALARDDRIGPSLAGDLDHVCVDEYQDVNALQVDILRALRQSDDRLTVVGDDSQAVYGFRGASPRHLLDIADAFPGIETVLLEQSYRSSQPILDVANALGDDAPEGFHARLRAVDPTGNRPELVRCADDDTQVQAVCERVLAHREEGIALKEQAVLVRAAHHSDLLEIELGRRRIPYVKYGGLRYLEAAHVKDLVCLFRMADNPHDRLAWFRVLQLLDGVGPATADKVLTALGVGLGGSEGEVLLRWPLAADLLPSGAAEPAEHLVRALRRADEESTGSHAARLRDVLAPLVARAYPDGAARCADLEALVAAAAESQRLSDLAADLTLEAPSSTGDLAGPPVIDEDWLVISTVHSAKGLEWDVVHLLNATDGGFPSDMAIGDKEGIEEERRLFYVAVTRPRRGLHVYVPLRFHHRPRARDDKHSFGQPSRFLSSGVTTCFEETTASHDPGGPADPFTAPIDVGVRVEVELDALWS